MSSMAKLMYRILASPVILAKKFLLRDVYQRLEVLEYRSYNRRFFAIEQTADFLIGAQIPGDYLEFGVYKGTTFSHAFKWMSPYFPQMRFVALDSFEGLPEPKGIDAVAGYTSNFHPSEFSYTEQGFLDNIAANGVDLARVRTVKGWFDQTLAPGTAPNIGVEKIACAWIDCDLYESTVPVLNYITPHLSIGTVIIFDDWRCYRNDPNFGEQRACREWLEENPQVTLAQLFSFGWNGIAFTVTGC